MKLRASLPLGLLALSVFALAAQGVVLKRAPKAGDKLKYKMTGNFQVQGADVVLNSTVTDEIKKVEGDVYVTESSTKGTVSVMGNDQDVPERVATTTSKLDGTIVEIKGAAAEDAGGNLYRVANLSLLMLPTTPIEMNGTWSTQAKKDDKRAVPGYKVDYRLVGEEKVGDWDAYKITADGKETEGEAPTSWKSTIWIEKTTGTLLRSVSDVTDVEFGPGVPPLSGKIELIRQP